MRPSPFIRRLPVCSVPALAAAFLVLAPAFAGAAEGGAAARDDSYQIRRGDVLAVSVYLEPELEKQVRVEADGTISLPLVGTVELAGRTVREMRVDLARRFDHFIVDPQVTLQVVRFARRAVNVIGQVNRPGPVEMPDEDAFTLLEAISAAGGWTRRGEIKNVSIRRRDPQGEEAIIKKDVRELLSDPDANDIELRDGDTVVVGERFV
jgi:polysaccharide export outer membrane protein